MDIRRHQRGYAAVVLMGALGFATTALVFTSDRHTGGAWQPLWQDAMQLNDERKRLIYYSVDYANLYGSGGSGPGHFPCPDTDVGDVRPGPNPPCGSTDVAEGKLPGGVSRPVGRVAFADSFGVRSSYSIVRGLVNNPSLGVNSNQWPAEHSLDGSKPGYAVLSRPSNQIRVIEKRQLKNPIHLWVRAWFIQHLMAAKFGHCTKPSPDEKAFSDQQVGDYTVMAVCAYEEEAGVDFNAIDCSIEHIQCLLRSGSLIQWMLGDEEVDWQGVPISRHWFVDNGWSELTSVQLELTCYFAKISCYVLLSNDSSEINVRLAEKVHRN